MTKKRKCKEIVYFRVGFLSMQTNLKLYPNLHRHVSSNESLMSSFVHTCFQRRRFDYDELVTIAGDESRVLVVDSILDLDTPKFLEKLMELICTGKVHPTQR